MSTQKGNEQANMSLVGHLREIRNRIVLSVVALLAAFVICFAIIKPLANAMLQMGLDAGFQYVYLSPSERSPRILSWRSCWRSWWFRRC